MASDCSTTRSLNVSVAARRTKLGALSPITSAMANGARHTSQSLVFKPIRPFRARGLNLSQIISIHARILRLTARRFAGSISQSSLSFFSRPTARAACRLAGIGFLSSRPKRLIDPMIFGQNVRNLSDRLCRCCSARRLCWRRIRIEQLRQLLDLLSVVELIEGASSAETLRRPDRGLLG